MDLFARERAAFLPGTHERREGSAAAVRIAAKSRAPSAFNKFFTNFEKKPPAAFLSFSLDWKALSDDDGLLLFPELSYACVDKGDSRFVATKCNSLKMPGSCLL